MEPLIKGNEPRVLVEFSAEEVTWLCDRLHEEWARTLVAKAITGAPTTQEIVDKHQEMQNRLRNRLLDKSFDQGFGHL